MRYLVAVLAVVCLAVSAGGAPANTEPTIADLAKEIETLKREVQTLRVLSDTRKAEMERRIGALDATYQRTLIRVAEICGENPEEVGADISPELKAQIEPLRTFTSDGRFTRRKILNAVAEKGRDAIGTVPVLVDTLGNDEDPFSRQYAARALGAVCAGANGELTRKALIALNTAQQKDADEKVRNEAKAAVLVIMR